MSDVEDTQRFSRPRPVLGDKGLSESELGALMAAGGKAFITGRDSGFRPWQPPPVEELQRALPQYEITEFIARGGMGAVYRGMQRALNRTVAIKVLPPEMCGGSGDLQFVERFKQEAQSMARLSHPNIVAVFDAGETADGLLYYVMEHAEGTDVAQVIAKDGRFASLRAVEIALAVCEALEFAHGEGFVHRDIKPANIVIDGRGRIKVADFGLAKALDLESNVRTGGELALGTPEFLAPETRAVIPVLDGRADIYSLGVTLYQMLTGEIPRGRFKPPSVLVKGIGRRLDAIVDRAMQPDIDERYFCVGEMGRDLEKAARALRASSGRPMAFMRVAMVAALALMGVLGWWSQWAGTGSAKGDGLRAGLGDAANVAIPKGRMGSQTNSLCNVLSTGVSFPVGQWIKPIRTEGDIPRELFDPLIGGRWEDGWLLAGDKAVQWQFQNVGLGRNHGIRATFHSFSPSKLSRLRVRNRSQQMYEIGEREPRLHVALIGETEFPASDWIGESLWPKCPPGESYHMEILVIGTRLFVRHNGHESLITDDHLAEGGPSFLIQHQGIRDVEVINLDGLSEEEALRAAGWGLDDSEPKRS